ncbi:uncharacterized protein LOC119839744 [Zerene cesonia]|uniref:uncharacterized protein LOC119839744 n=1 Tax=Zerene cesonia TaxID=33412 RepID=UPI0018E4FAA7|nr:uncharacterized protein LOC119839744 [Zerene cesonia]
MRRTYQVILICYICIVLFLLIDRGKSDTQVRTKRYLSFRNVTKFFIRLNFKANMVPWNQIFAQAIGFRLNWDDPPDSFHPYHHFSRRSIYNNLEILLDSNGLNGFHCIRRAICETNTISAPRGIYFKILKMVFRQQSSATDKWHNHTTEDCAASVSSCPFSMLEVSPYTDL